MSSFNLSSFASRAYSVPTLTAGGRRSPMDTSDDVLMLGDVLLGMWSARDRLQRAGLAADRGAPIGGLAQSLTAAALWPSVSSVPAAYGRARAVRTGFDESGAFGPAVGGWKGPASALGIDLAIPWTSVVQRVPALSAFAQQRRGERWAWDASAGTPPFVGGEGPLEDRYSGLARVRVRARFAPRAPDEGSVEAISYRDVRSETTPLNDLYVLVLFARVDEGTRTSGRRISCGRQPSSRRSAWPAWGMRQVQTCSGGVRSTPNGIAYLAVHMTFLGCSVLSGLQDGEAAWWPLRKAMAAVRTSRITGAGSVAGLLLIRAPNTMLGRACTGRPRWRVGESRHGCRRGVPNGPSGAGSRAARQGRARPPSGRRPGRSRGAAPDGQ